MVLSFPGEGVHQECVYGEGDGVVQDVDGFVVVVEVPATESGDVDHE